ATGAADLALVEEDPADNALDGLVERGVVEDDVGGLAAELEGRLLARARDRAGDHPPDGRAAGEGDLVDARVVDDRLSRRSRARDDVDDPGRQLGLLADLGEEQRGEGSRLSRLEDDGVAAGQSGRDLPREHEEREVPRDDLAHDAGRATTEE